MSETIEAPVAELAPEPVDTAPPPPAATPAPAPAEAEAAPAAETPAAEAEEPKQEPWFVKRIAQLTAGKSSVEREAAQAARERDAALAELAALRAPPPAADAPQQQPQGQLTQAQIDTLITQRAQQLANQQAYAARETKFVTQGRTEFADFDTKCGVVASAGATDRPEFMDVITDMDDGPRVVMHLADNPQEAVRVLGLPPLKMAAALARISGELAKPKPAAPLSAAPKPITPIAGGARAETDLYSEDTSPEDFARAWEKRKR